MADLAILGGEKTIETKTPHFIWPIITKETERAVLNQLKESISIYDNSGMIGKLENNLSTFFNKKHSLLTNSGTSALYSMYISANLSKGDEVICPAYTFFATVTPLFFTGAIPVLADCDENGNIDPKEMERKITKKTKAVVVTHMWGMPCQIKEIEEICKKNNLLLLEDISHSFGAEYFGRKVGAIGDAAACSLQGQKTITGGEGGFFISDSDEMFYRALALGHYNKRCKNEIPSSHYLSDYAITGMGMKFRIHPLSAAIANEQLSKIKEILEGRNKIAKRMIKELKGLPGIRVPIIDEKIKHGWYAFIIKCLPEELDNLSIEKFYEALKAEGCTELDIPNSTSPLNLLTLFQNPSKIFPDYKNLVSYKKGDFPKAEKFYSSILKLPVWHRKENEKIVDLYIKSFKKVIKNHKSLLENPNKMER